MDQKIDQPSSQPLSSTRLMLELCIDLHESDTDDENVLAILKHISSSVIANFSLLEYFDHLSHREQTYQTYRMPNYKKDPAVPLAKFFGRLGQQDQHELLARIKSQCVELSEQWFRTFAIPFCRGLTSFLDISSTPCRQCIHTLLDQYIRRTVGPEPEQPTDWRRPEEVASQRSRSPNCGCVEKIDAFLLDPEAASLEIHCRSSNLSWSFNHFAYFEVSSGGEVRTRTITKTTKSWEERLKSWKERASDATSAVKTLSEPVLKQVLGNGYDSILELRNVKAAGGVSWQSKESKRDQTRSVAGRKRLRAETSSPEGSQDELSLDYKLMGCQRIQEDAAGPQIFVRMR